MAEGTASRIYSEIYLLESIADITEREEDLGFYPANLVNAIGRPSVGKQRGYGVNCAKRDLNELVEKGLLKISGNQYFITPEFDDELTRLSQGNPIRESLREEYLNDILDRRDMILKEDGLI